jgi:hypothetical protein
MDTPAPAPRPAFSPAEPFAAPGPAPHKRINRWVLRIGLTTTLVAAGLVAAAPTIVSENPKLRDYLVRRFMGKLNGDIVIKEFSVGWFSPLKIEGLALLPHADSQPVPGDSEANREALVNVAKIQTERELWQMLWDRADIGTIRIEKPEVFIALGEKGLSNFTNVFRPILEDDAKTPRSLTFGARAQIVDGTLRGKSAETREPWEIKGINLAVGVRSEKLAQSWKPELYVEKGTLVSKAELDVGLCNDVLKYIAPVFAQAAQARGTVSIELEDWRLPWKDFASGELAGTVTMNSVDVGPGTLTKSILNKAAGYPIVGEIVRGTPVPNFINVARDSVVTFKMIDGRIHHEGLRFDLAGLFDVASQGSVGLDETLDLETKMGFHPPNKEARKLAVVRQLDDQAWTVYIRGKLGAPEVDASPIGEEIKNLFLHKTPADWLSGRDSVGARLLGGIAERVIQSDLLPPEARAKILSQIPPPPGAPNPNAPLLNGPLNGNPLNGGPMNGSTLNGGLNAPSPSPRNLVPGNVGPSLGSADGSAATNSALPSAVPPPPPTAAAPTGTAPAFGAGDVLDIGLDVFSAIRARRQQQQRSQVPPPSATPPQPSPPGPGNASGLANPQANGFSGPTIPNAGGNPAAPPPPAGRRPFLRQGFRALLDAATQPPTAAPQPTGSATAGAPPAAQPPVSQPPAAQPPAPANREP